MSEKKGTFEAKYQRLEAIVKKFSLDETPLDELLKLFNEGKTLVEELKQELEQANQEVKKQLAE